MKALSARCRMMVNNINKSASAKILQPEWETGLRTSKKPADFLIRALRVCERATLESRKGHSCNVTVAFLQAPLDLFRPIFGSQYVSVKFKRLIISVLEMSPKSLICAQVGCPLRMLTKGNIVQLSPISTSSSIYTNGNILQLSPIFAFGETSALGLISLAIILRFKV